MSKYTRDVSLLVKQYISIVKTVHSLLIYECIKFRYFSNDIVGLPSKQKTAV